jgi:TRAP transporter TAXI family solute receptor
MTTPLLALLSLTGLALAANASEVVSVAASTKGTLFDQAGTAVAKVATNNGDLGSTVRNYTSANVFMPAIARGQVDFGVANQYEVMLAMTGQSHFAGRDQPNLRAVAVLFPLRIATFVKLDSAVQRIADLKGHRMPDGYVANKIILPLIDATLAAEGLTRDDVVALNVPGLVSGADAFISGRTEGFLMALRAPKVREANARHGIRALPLENTPATLAAIRQHMPVAYFALEEPGPAKPGIIEPTWVIAYDTLLFASTETSEETVYRMTRALFGNRENLIAASPAFRLFSSDAMAKDLGVVEYHPGAIRFYREQGLWPPVN